jgi:hypothetical protein
LVIETQSLHFLSRARGQPERARLHHVTVSRASSSHSFYRFSFVPRSSRMEAIRLLTIPPLYSPHPCNLFFSSSLRPFPFGRDSKYVILSTSYDARSAIRTTFTHPFEQNTPQFPPAKLLSHGFYAFDRYGYLNAPLSLGCAPLFFTPLASCVACQCHARTYGMACDT